MYRNCWFNGRLIRNSISSHVLSITKQSQRLVLIRTDSTIAASLPADQVSLLVKPFEGIALNALGEPSIQALGFGCWYTPVGWVQCLLEYLHADFAFSWCSSIAICSLIIRLAMFPVAIISQRNAAKMKLYMPGLQELQSQLMSARLRGDNFETLQTAEKLRDYMKRFAISPFANMIPVAIQSPVFLSAFLAIRGLSNFPLASMTTGGALWFSDLSECDPFYILPIIVSFTMYATVEAGLISGTAPVKPVYKNIFRAMPFALFPISTRFSSAILIYWLTTNCISCTQTLILNVPAIRRLTGIPHSSDVGKRAIAQPEHNKGFLQEMKKSYSNSKLLAEIEDRHKVDAERFKKAGSGAIIPTFKVNPRNKME